MSVAWLLAAGVGFLLGSVPWALVVGKALRGVDVRSRGSGNLGATNAFRVLGPGLGIVVLLLDIAKGWGAAELGLILGERAGDPLVGGVVGGLACILGHVFSPWVRFRGGKGVAAAAGCFTALAPQAMLGSVVVWAGLLAATRFVSVASLGGALALPILVWLFGRRAESGSFVILVLLSLAVSGLIIIRHVPNLRRLRAGTETSLRFRRAGAKGD